ncbi:TrmH family RNA methyltransferase [Chloroflexus aggregans]|uniref:tRNA/rRNA methyltransferase (SpoU) n=1 Tax=Chloroflexus aggregans (strain MD-66 / DSM 9485) TaxID=326427 RepID=B8G5E4_CHLAD|nr:RNA methyltransferase [Chloroflexus aggregans]ACL25650.1 tRNA/rRNA methyltransferase (SpoU) [Chloroflexus aggregans DSM 9485]
MLITSLTNPTIKMLRALRQRKARDEQGRYLIEGIRLVGEAIQCGAPLEMIIVAPDLLTSSFAHELVEHYIAGGGRVLTVSAEVLGSLASKEHPQGIIGVGRARYTPLADLVAGVNGWVALVDVADPGNLGTILRTADGAGFSGVILIGSTVDPFDPAAVRASMGALFSQQIARAGWDELLAWRQARSLPVIGSSDRGTVDYRTATYPRPLILVLGSERQGLSDEQLAACDTVVRIPMRGRSDSLNLAVAAGILMYEITRDT